MEHLFWFFQVQSAYGILSAISFPLLVGLALYQTDYAFLLLRHLFLGARGRRELPRLSSAKAPSALLVMPTLLRNKDELEGMKRAIRSTVTNGYPGSLVVVASIDDGGGNPVIYRELESWVATLACPPGVKVFATGTTRRTGKAVAIAHAIGEIEHKVARGELSEFPTLFFNMDGDSELGPHALERMVVRLLKPRPISGQRPMIVTSNVCIDQNVYWKGWREYFSVRGQIAILVAREYLTSISLGKSNTRLMPVQEASGALYCTWSVLHEQAPRWAAFMQTLTLKSWLLWWVGVAPPSFAKSGVAPLPEAQTGPGDDTWMTWIACCARWTSNGSISLELPRTPFHAFIEMIYGYFFRGLAYEPTARIVTKTPTTITALFKQRVRWNSSRIQDFQRWFPAFAFHWRAALGVVVTTALVLYVHSMIVASLVLFPFIGGSHGRGAAALLLAFGFNMVTRALSTVFALKVDSGMKRHWRMLLGLPLAIPYHLVFNICTTISGMFQDIFLFGVNTKFSPEETYIKSKLSRIALGYRVRRAFALAIRSVVVGDVPLGTFWFGWHATEWTPSGFEGWTSGKKKRVLLPRVASTPAAAVPVVMPAPFAPVAPIAAVAAEAPMALVASILPARHSLPPVSVPALADMVGNVISMAEARKTLRPRAPSLRPGHLSIAPAPASIPAASDARMAAFAELVNADLQRTG